MLQIYSPEGHWDRLAEDERAALYEEYFALDRALGERGALVGSHELEPAATATSVRVRDGETLVTDGPFAETKEQLGGYYVVEAESLDEAIEWAARIPSARHGTIEIRPVVPHGEEAA
ncbi:MAG TPA: YciI family protein [Gaiellaceae bacterium]|nr:YciI family protein [Gaiellaceae bacterium]